MEQTLKEEPSTPQTVVETPVATETVEEMPKQAAMETIGKLPTETALKEEPLVDAMEKLDVSKDTIQEKKGGVVVEPETKAAHEEPVVQVETEATKSAMDGPPMEESAHGAAVQEVAAQEAAVHEPSGKITEHPAVEEPAATVSKEPAVEEPDATISKEPVVEEPDEEAKIESVKEADVEPAKVALEPEPALAGNPGENSIEHAIDKAEVVELSEKSAAEEPVKESTEQLFTPEHEKATEHSFPENLPTEKPNAPEPISEIKEPAVEESAPEVGTVAEGPVNEGKAALEEPVVPQLIEHEVVKDEVAKEEPVNEGMDKLQTNEAGPVKEELHKAEENKDEPHNESGTTDALANQGGIAEIPIAEPLKEAHAVAGPAEKVKPSTVETSTDEEAIKDAVTETEPIAETQPMISAAEEHPEIVAPKDETTTTGEEKPVAEETVAPPPLVEAAVKSGHVRVDSAIDGMTLEDKDRESAGKDPVAEKMIPIAEVNPVGAGKELV